MPLTVENPNTNWINILDDLYKQSSLTGAMDAPAGVIQATQNAKKIKVPRYSAKQGLKNYDKASGYDTGTATLTFDEYELSKDRNRKFVIDRMDNNESLDVAIGTLGREFVKDEVVPEIDAYRFSELVDNANNDNVNERDEDTITDDNVLSIIDGMIADAFDEEIAEEDLLLYVSNTVYKHLKNAADLRNSVMPVEMSNGLVINRKIQMLDNIPVIPVPKGRFITHVDLLNTSDGGFQATEDTGKKINVALVSKSAVMGVVKHEITNVFTPQENQSHDGWAICYRLYHDFFALEAKKEKGIFIDHDDDAINPSGD